MNNMEKEKISPYIYVGINENHNKNIIYIVCEHYNTTYDKLKEKNRKQHSHVMIRQIIYYLSKMRDNPTWYALADLFNQNHSNAISGVKKIQNIYDTELFFRNEITKLEEMCGIMKHKNYNTNEYIRNKKKKSKYLK